MLELNELLDIFNAGDALVMDEEAADACNYYSIEAQKITCELNYNFDKCCPFPHIEEEILEQIDDIHLDRIHLIEELAFKVSYISV